jgi:hypothetical protein
VAIIAFTSLLISRSAAVTVCANKNALAGSCAPFFPAAVAFRAAASSPDTVHQLGSLISSSSTSLVAMSGRGSGKWQVGANGHSLAAPAIRTSNLDTAAVALPVHPL